MESAAANVATLFEFALEVILRSQLYGESL